MLGFIAETDAPTCHECGSLLVRQGAHEGCVGGCHLCAYCGARSGCPRAAREPLITRTPTLLMRVDDQLRDADHQARRVQPELACPSCAAEMQPEHAHYRCPRCGYRDSCCM